MTFGEKLRILRKEKGLSQTALAELVGTTKRTILCYETGAFYPRDRETYAKLAEALGCNELYLKSEDADASINRLQAYATALANISAKSSSQPVASFDIDIAPATDDEANLRRFRAYMLQFIMSDTKLPEETKNELCERAKTWSPANH